jgi:hypothetical protein
VTLARRQPTASSLDRYFYSPKLGGDEIRNVYSALAKGAERCRFVADDLEGTSLADLDALTQPTISNFAVYRWARESYMTFHVTPSVAILSAPSINNDVLVIERQIDAIVGPKSHRRWLAGLLTLPRMAQYLFFGLTITLLAFVGSLVSEAKAIGDPTTTFWVVWASALGLFSLVTVRRPSPDPIVLSDVHVPFWRNVSLVSLLVAVVTLVFQALDFFKK